MKHTPSTYLYLIRHGESDINTIPGTYGGRQNESPLTATGIEQAKHLGRFMVREAIVPTHVFSSPARRAYDTGVFSLREAGVTIPIVPTDDLQELDRGEWTGRLRKDIAADAVIQAAVAAEGMHYRPVGAESMSDVFKRMLDWAAVVRDPRHTPDNPQHIAAYTHSNAIGCFVAAATDIERTFTHVIPIDQASISVFSDLPGGRWLAEDVNINTQPHVA